jgi:hypothetical protein
VTSQSWLGMHRHLWRLQGTERLWNAAMLQQAARPRRRVAARQTCAGTSLRRATCLTGPQGAAAARLPHRAWWSLHWTACLVLLCFSLQRQSSETDNLAISIRLIRQSATLADVSAHVNMQSCDVPLGTVNRLATCLWKLGGTMFTSLDLQQLTQHWHSTMRTTSSSQP